MIKSEVKSRKFCETNDYITMEYLLKREGTRLNDSHIPIIRRLITIGRSPNCTITLKSIRVSRLHCEIIYNDGNIFLRDTQSSNGTYVNNEKLTNESRKLEVGDLIGFGINPLPKRAYDQNQFVFSLQKYESEQSFEIADDDNSDATLNPKDKVTKSEESLNQPQKSSKPPQKGSSLTKNTQEKSKNSVEPTRRLLRSRSFAEDRTGPKFNDKSSVDELVESVPSYSKSKTSETSTKPKESGEKAKNPENTPNKANQSEDELTTLKPIQTSTPKNTSTPKSNIRQLRSAGNKIEEISKPANKKASEESSVPEKIDKNPKSSIKTRSSDRLSIKTTTDRNFLPKTRSSDTLDTSESTTDASGTKTLPKTKSSDKLIKPISNSKQNKKNKDSPEAKKQRLENAITNKLLTINLNLKECFIYLQRLTPEEINQHQNEKKQVQNDLPTQPQPDIPTKKLKSEELQPQSSSTLNQTQKSEINLLNLDKRSSNTENLHNLRSKLRKLLIGKQRSYSESLGVSNTKNISRATRKSSISIDPSCQDSIPPPNSSATPKSPTKHTNESSQLASSINLSLEPNTHADKIDCIETDAKTSVPTHVHSISTSTDDIDEKWKKIRNLIEIEKKRLRKREIESATEVTIVEESKNKEEVPKTTEAIDSIENNKNDEIVNKYREKVSENNKVEILSVENVRISPRRIDDILSKFDQVGEKVNNLLTSEVKRLKRNVEDLTENSIELIIDESIDEGLESSSGRGDDRNQGLEVVSSIDADLIENNELNGAQKQDQKTTEFTKLELSQTGDNILKDLEDNSDLSTKTSNFKDHTTVKQAELSEPTESNDKTSTSTNHSQLQHFEGINAKNSEDASQNIEENTQNLKNLQNLEAKTQQTSIELQIIDENAQKLKNLQNLDAKTHQTSIELQNINEEPQRSSNIKNPATLTQKLSIEPQIHRTTEISNNIASESINSQNLDATIQKTTVELQNLTTTSKNLQNSESKSQESSNKPQNSVSATLNLSKSDQLLLTLTSHSQYSTLTEEPQRPSELESLLRSSNAALPKITSELPFAHPESKNSLESSKPAKSDSQKPKKVIENWTAIKTGPSSLRITKTSIANFKESNDVKKIKRRYSVHEPVTSKDNTDSKYSIKTRRSSAYQESTTLDEASTISKYNTDTTDQSYQKHRPSVFPRTILIDPLPRYEVAVKNQTKKPKTDLQSKVKRSYSEMMKNFTSGPTPPPSKMPKIDTQFKKKIIFSNGSEVDLDDVRTIEILDDVEETTTESVNLVHSDGDLDHLLTDKPQVLPSGESDQVFNKYTGNSRSDANTRQNIQHAEVISRLKAKKMQNQQLMQQPQSSNQISHPDSINPSRNSIIIEYFNNHGRLVSQTITSQQAKPQTYRNHQPMHISSFSEKTKEFLLNQLKLKLNNIKASQKNHGQQPVAIKVGLSKSEYDNLPDLDDYLLDHELNFILSYKFKKYQLIDCDEAIRRIERLYLKISGKSIKPLYSENLIQNEAFSKVKLNEQLPSSLGFSNFGEVIKTIEQNAGTSKQQQILPQQLEAALNQRTIHSAQNSLNQVPENSTIVEIVDVTDWIASHEAPAINQQIILIPQANLPQFLPIPATQNADGSQIYMQNPQFVVTVQNQEQNQETAIEEPVVESNKPQRYTFIDREDEVLIIENNPQQILTSDRLEAMQIQAEGSETTNKITEKPLSMPLSIEEVLTLVKKKRGRPRKSKDQLAPSTFLRRFGKPMGQRVYKRRPKEVEKGSLKVVKSADQKLEARGDRKLARKATNNKSVAIYQESGTKDHTSGPTDHNLTNRQQTPSKLHPPITENVKNEAEIMIHTSLEEEPVLEVSVESDLPEELDAEIKSDSQAEIECSSIDIGKEEIIEIVEGNDPAGYEETEDPAEDLQLPELLPIYSESDSKANSERASIIINDKVTTTPTTNPQDQVTKPSQNDLPTAEPQFLYLPYPDASIEDEDTDTLSEPEDITPFYPKFSEAQVILERLTDEVIALAMSSIKRLESTSIYHNFASKHSDILDSKGISTQEATRIKKRSLSFDEEAPPPKKPQISTKSTFSSSAIKTLLNSTQNKDSEDFEDDNEDEAIKRHRLGPEFYYEDPDYAPTTSKSHQVVRPADLDKFCNRNSDDDEDDEDDDDMDNYGSEAYGTRIPTVSKMSQRYHKNYLSTIRTNEVAEEAEQVCIELSDEEVEADEYSVSDDERIMKMPILSEKNLLPKEKSILAKEGKNDGKRRKVSFYNSVNVRTFFADDE